MARVRRIIVICNWMKMAAFDRKAEVTSDAIKLFKYNFEIIFIDYTQTHTENR